MYRMYVRTYSIPSHPMLFHPDPFGIETEIQIQGSVAYPYLTVLKYWKGRGVR